MSGCFRKMGTIGLESEQVVGPVAERPQQDAEAQITQAPASAVGQTTETNIRRGGRQQKYVGPALKSVPERRKTLGRLDKSDVQPGRIAPIIMPAGTPVARPIGLGGTLAPAEIPVIRPPAGRATFKRRHRLTVVTFLLLVILPVSILAGYLFTFAQDQFASEAGFSVRKEEGSGSLDMLGGLTQFTGSASTDAEILYDFIRSPDLVHRLDQDFDLFKVFGRDYVGDPLFSLKPDATIEEKQAYWENMVTVEYNEATGLIRLEVRAFTPEEAQRIGHAIIDYSSLMINRLSDSARDDATRYAKAELEKAVENLKTTRAAITEFRSREQVIDPTEDIRGQTGLMNSLEARLADALIELDILKSTVTGSDVRINQGELRIEVIQKQLDEERKKFGIGDGGTDARNSYAETVAEYERLVVDKEVAEERFRGTTLLYNAAEAEANRKSRYLAAHIEPTLAEGAIYPRFTLILLMTGFFLTLGWALIILVYYSIRDRR
jgi:capsular polysaccharide transport system permease protein